MAACSAHVRFRGKADMTICGNSLLRSQSGVKRTWACAPHMFAYDPKRTSSEVLYWASRTSVSIATIPDESSAGGMRRREVITLLGGAAVWPLAARAQQRDRLKYLGVLWGLAENDNVYEPYLSAFKQRIEDLGWIDGRNVRVEYRFTGGVNERIHVAARELVALAPDVIFATTNPAVAALLQETRTVPIVFTLVSDSVGSGFVPSLAHPGGNITGFHNFEPDLSGKWLEILKDVAPELRRVAFLHHPQTAAHIGFLRVIEATSSSARVTVTAAGARDASEIEPALTAFAREPNSGLIVAPSPITTFRRELIIALARQLNLPAMYPFRYFPESGGLVSYGIDQMEQARGGAAYIDRVLRGANPGELPVQLPTKYELAINLKTAKSLNLKIPESFLLRADEVIE
jgi:putative tryptophan/tyrosine transport system substrate-binding protein